jgi:hypothetical protein
MQVIPGDAPFDAQQKRQNREIGGLLDGARAM